jgi:hypothetical protein
VSGRHLTCKGSGRGWTSVSMVVDGDNTVLNAFLVEQAISLVNGSSTDVVIPKSMIAAGNYVVTVTVANFLGGNAVQSLAIEKTAVQIPEIRVIQEHNNISPHEFYSIKASSSVTCNDDNDNVVYSWVQTAGNAITFESSTTTPTLALTPFQTLPNSQYKFELSAGYVGKESKSYEVVINTEIDEISANAGSSKKVSTEQDIILIPTIIDESYRSPLDLTSFSCTWAVVDSNNVAVTIPDTATCASLTLTGSLPAGEYVVGISVVNSVTGSSTTGSNARISVANNKIPIVQIDASSLNPGRNSPSFVINARVDPSSVDDPTAVSFTWISKASCNEIAFSTIALEQGVTTETDPSRDSSLSFKNNKLVPKV